MVTPRIVTSGAVTVTTLPAPPPSSTAPGRPLSTTRRSILIAPLYSPGASSMTSPSCARSSTACSGCSGAAFSVSATAKPGDSGGEDRRRKDAQEGAHVSFPPQADGLGSTSMRPFISMCMAWQNHEQ